MTIPLAAFGNLMGMDGLMIMMVLLLLFGAKKLPELARGLGQSLNEFKKAREDIEGEFKAGQDSPNPREAANRQAYGQVPPAPVPQQPALGYTAPGESQEALQRQVAELQKKLEALEAQKHEQTTSAS